MQKTTMRHLLTAAALLVAFASPAEAQSMRTPVPRGQVSGLEMGLEGAQEAPRGGTLRWLVTAYEVLGLSELRPAAGADVLVTTSLAPMDERVIRADALGRALVEIAVPEDAPHSFGVALRLARGDVQRRFELTVGVTPTAALELHLDRQRLPLGAPLRAFGRVSDVRSGRARAGAEVRLTLRDSRRAPIGAPVVVRTDAAGLFAHRFRMPRELGPFAVEARVGEEGAQVLRTTQVVEPHSPPLLLAVAPERRLLRPGERIEVEVAVRTSNGRPIDGAEVTVVGVSPQEPRQRATTDARGRARLAWRAPVFSQGLRDVEIAVVARREGIGSVNGAATVRVAVEEHAAGLAVEGGALSPELGGRLWVRVVGADGRPAGAGVPVELEGPRLGRQSASTGDDGVATFDVRLGPSREGDADRCGGESATAITVRAGSATRTPCLPLDPDAAARVRVARPLLIAGAPLEVEVERVRAAARAPVELTVMSARGPSAVTSAILAPGESRVSLPLPADTGGLLFVRARPLIGASRQVVRGGSAAFWVSPAAPLSLEASFDPSGRVNARFDGPHDEPVHTYVVAAPVDDAWALASTLASHAPGHFEELARPPAQAGEALLSGALAARVPLDLSAPAVLRAGRVVPLPAPSDPVAAGLLRDPWRARSRFVSGRLALILHALEAYVERAVPERLDDVAVRSSRGYEFNAQILEAVAQSDSLGPAGATGLGGEPLTLEELRRFDPSLTYDNVARRITRERLFRLLVALRAFVQRSGFDLPWSRLGDPSSWLSQLVGTHTPEVGSLDRRQLVDGWGRPFRLLPARGGRSRFRFVDPLGAWELVSAGPDGRFGTADDVWDPTARVLRSGTPYAEAVGEDVLVARLTGLELGRASLALLRNTDPALGQTGALPDSFGEPALHHTAELWRDVPSPYGHQPDPLALRRPAHPGHGAGGQIEVLPPEGGALTLALDAEPRAWGAVVYAWTPSGAGGITIETEVAGAPVLVDGRVPSHLRAGEPVTLALALVGVRGGATYRVEASGEGVEVEAPRELMIREGEATPLTLRLRPSTPGQGSLDIALRDAAGDALSWSWPLRRTSGMHPLRLRASGIARGREWSTSLPVPGDAERVVGRVVLLAPSALASDPDLADLRRRDPALVAWSNALAGRLDRELRARLLRAQDSDGSFSGDAPAISTAAAAVALAGMADGDPEAQHALDRVRAYYSRSGRFRSESPEDVSITAAALAVLAAGGMPVHEDRSSIELAAESARRALRRILREHPEEPSLLARAAAALLLADPEDAYGLAMLERASAHVVDAPDGGAMLRPSEALRQPLEALSSTLALALAAHQAEQAELAERLLRGGLMQEHVALRQGGEAALWLLASGAYGALGVDAREVEVVVNGERHALTLEAGRETVSLPSRTGAHEVRVNAAEGTVFVRAELAMERPFTERRAGPLVIELRGVPGGLGELAALELSVRAERAVNAPQLTLSLPAGVAADERLLAVLEQAPGVSRAEAREPAMVRLTLSSMAAGTEVIVPLPLRWTVSGTLSGLGIIAFPADDPAAMSILPPRELEIDRR